MNFNPGPTGFFRRLSPLQQVRYEFHLIIYRSRFRAFFFNQNRRMTRLSNHSSLVGDPYRIKAYLVYREQC
jgi:hypothetical protein